MLRLNRMTDYAIIVLGALAQRHGKTMATGHLAELTGLAQPTVAKVSKLLLAAGLVETQRGVRGGYRLDKASAHISLIDVVEAMEGPIAVLDCEDDMHTSQAGRCCCFMRNHLNHVNLAIRKALTEVTLEDLTTPPTRFSVAEASSIEDKQRIVTPQSVQKH
jgi:FeS assembly SUF system regulator